MRRISRQGRASIVAVGVAAVFALLLPALLGRFALSQVRQMAARHLHGELEADSCSLGWFGGLRCEQVRYRDPERGVRFEARALTSDKGVLLLLLSPSFLGDITLTQPVLTFLPPPPESRPAAGAAGAQTASSPDGEQQRESPWWERLTFRIKASGGQMLFDRGAAGPRQIARQCELDGSLAMGSLHYDLSFLSAQQSGRLQATGFINLPLAGQSLPEMLVTGAEVRIIDLEIADFLQLAASRSQTPTGQGILNATLSLHIAGTREFETRGETSLRDLRLSGGILGEDHPSLKELDFRFAGGYRQENGWRLDDLELRSEPVLLSAKGGFNAGAGNLSATGRVDLPILAAQIPRLLRMHEQTTITEGSVDFSLAASGDGQAVTVAADCRTELLRLVHAGHPYSWTLPLAIAAKADYGDGGATIRSLRVQTPFFEAQGNGDRDGFSLRAGGDLDRMSQELRTIFDFDVQAKGRIELTAASRKAAGEGIGGEGRLVIRDFAWTRGNKPLLPPHDLHISGQAVVSPRFFLDGTFDSLQVEASAWPGKCALRAEDIRRSLEEQDNCTLSGEADLARLGEVALRLRGEPLFSGLQGALRFEGAGFCAIGTKTTKITLRALQGMIERLAFAGSGLDIREPEARFALGTTEQPGARQIGLRALTVVDNWQGLDVKARPVFQIDSGKRRLAVRRLAWASPTAQLTLSGTIEDWQQPSADFSLSLTGETPAALLGDLARNSGWLPPDASVAGTARGSLAVHAAAGRNRSAELNLDLASFAVLRGKKQVFADPHPVARLVLDMANRAGEPIKIPSLLLRSTLCSIEGAGSMSATAPPILDMRGRMVCDYAALLPLLHPGRDVVASGSRPADILLSLPVQWPLPVERLTFTAQAPVDALSLSGLSFKPLVAAVDSNLGKLRCRLDGPLEGGGRATLEPVWDLAAPQPALSLPAEGQTVQDAALRPALVRLLGRVHPLFGLVATPQGTIGVRPSVFVFSPTDKGAQQPEFTVALAMNRAKFKPTGALRELLTLAGFTQEWFSTKEQELVCEGNKGKVHCAPVHLLAGDLEIGLQGDLLPDGALRYRASLPMTRQLAEQTQLVVQGKALVEAELGGNRGNPAFDAAAFLAGLPAQLHQEVGPAQAAGGQQTASADKKTAPADSREAGVKQ